MDTERNAIDDEDNIQINNNSSDNQSETGTNEDRLGAQYQDPDLWPADRLNQIMGDNMAIAEALTDENPIRTENTPEENK